MDRDPSLSGREQFSTFVSWSLFVCQALAVSVEVFLHRSRSFGERYMGLQAGAAILVIFFYPVFWPEHDATPMVGFLFAYLAMCAIVRVCVVTRRRGSEPQHTHYTGRPRIMRITGRLSELTVKRGVEPMLLFLSGVFTLPASEPLGSYLMLAAFGLFVSVNLSLAFERTRALDMRDAYLEQRGVAERFREMHRN